MYYPSHEQVLEAIAERNDGQFLQWMQKLPNPQTPDEQLIEDQICEYVVANGLDTGIENDVDDFDS